MDSISFASGSTNFYTPVVASNAAIQAIQQNRTFYGLAAGTTELREAIAHRYYYFNHIAVNPENILVTPGTRQALYNILHTILKPGDEVIIPAPNWFGLHEVLQQLQAKLIILPTKAADNYVISPEVIQQYISARTRLFLYSNPNNPTGRVYALTEISSWLRLLDQYPDIYVLADEIYDLVIYDEHVASLLELPDTYQKHIVVNGFSKAFAMSGWRIGYLITPPTLTAACLQFQKATFSGVSEFVQAAALAALQHAPEILSAFNNTLRQNLAVMGEFFDRLEVPFIPPQAAYYLFPDLTAYLRKQVNSTAQLTTYLKEAYNLEIMPGEYFGAPSYARFSFALTPETLENGLVQLDKALLTLL